jgi:hypothetical protein
VTAFRAIIARSTFSMVPAIAAFCGSAWAGMTIPLLDDTRFERGFIVLSPMTHPKARVGVIRPGNDKAEPVWELAQWYSRLSRSDVQPKCLHYNVVRYFRWGKGRYVFPCWR